MDTDVTEIAAGIYRLSTLVPDAVPGGLTFNQYLVTGEQPLLFHTGLRGLFPLTSAAAATVLPLEQLRWVTFGHVEADECGAMNQWLAAAPQAEVLFNDLGVQVSLNDLADRPPVSADPAVPTDIGGHLIRVIPTPHVPHNWEAQVIYDETTRTLFCGDLFTRTGPGPALVEGTDIVQPALDAENLFHATAPSAGVGETIRALADLEIDTLALMHGSAFTGDCSGALRDLADAFDRRLAPTA